MKTVFAGLAAIIVVIVFVSASIASASDPQGAIVFLLALPMCLLVGAIGFALSGPRSAMRRLLLALGIFLAAFVVAAVTPPLRFFPDSVISGIAKSFESIVGMSPAAWAKRKSKESVEIHAGLEKAADRIDDSVFSVVPRWDRICFLGPYSTEDDAAKVLGYSSATLAQSRVPHSDSVTALVFLDSSGTLAVVDVSRSVVDFSPLSKRCLDRADFPIAIERSRGGAVARPAPE